MRFTKGERDKKEGSRPANNLLILDILREEEIKEDSESKRH